MPGVSVEPVTAREVRPLRGAVLRPGQPPEALVYPGDDLPGALHAAVRDEDGSIVGVASIAPEPHPRNPRAGDWRLRGMATAPEARGRGLGAALLSACIAHARERGGERVWCNARTTAEGFYAREGFTVEGERFELPDIGLHALMSLSLRG